MSVFKSSTLTPGGGLRALGFPWMALLVALGLMACQSTEPAPPIAAGNTEPALFLEITSADTGEPVAQGCR